MHRPRDNIDTKETDVSSPLSPQNYGSPVREFNDNSHGTQFDDHEKPRYTDLSDDGNNSIQSDEPNFQLYPSESDSNNIDNEQDQNDSDHIEMGQAIPSLSLIGSGYDTEEDDDGVLKRFHDQANSSLQLNLGPLNDDHHLHSPNSELSTNQNGNVTDGTQRKKRKPTADRIKDVIHGMRTAHENAQRQRSTRQFLAMSEGRITAHSFTEIVCLSSWCNFDSGRGMAVMIAILFILVSVVYALIRFEHYAGGIWTFVLGITVITIRRFWVQIYFLVWGQFIENRRRRNVQRYDALNEEMNRTISNELPSQNGVDHNTENDTEYCEKMNDKTVPLD
eukprot:scaffold4432_cov76-Cyclotella_meneghiniana.AAC.4